jgi:precorrin-6B methylase 2
MNFARPIIQLLLASYLAAPGAVLAQTPGAPYEPLSGQAGKDVVWVPSAAVMVDRMLDVAKVTPADYVIDLGSGDGRNVIAAAKRGAQALGVEYNNELVEYSRRAAEKEGVADKALFVQGDMYAADISRATVMALFLLSDNLLRLTPKLLGLKPGTRIVANTFGIEGWSAEETHKVEGDCEYWCVVLLYIVPARVAGTWRLAQGEIKLEQKFQTLSGTLSSGGASTPISNGRLHGDQIRFSAGGADYAGRVNGDTMQGDVKGATTGTWTSTRMLAAP